MSTALADPGKAARAQRERELEHEYELGLEAQMRAADIAALLAERQRVPSSVAEQIEARRSRVFAYEPLLAQVIADELETTRERDTASQLAAVELALAEYGDDPEAARRESLEKALQHYRKAAAARGQVAHESAVRGIDHVAGLLEAA